MKFLLVNTNPAVKKIFSIAARKASIRLDFANSIQEISIQEDYICIFIDDGVLNTGNIQDIRNKMITTKFCLIMSKDSQTIPDFDNYIKKPFLPTDIYEVLRQEKRNDISFSSFETDIQGDSNDRNIRNGINSIDLLDDIDDSNANSDITSNINNIDLSEFSDSDDEFLSGIQDSASVIHQNNEELKFAYQDYNDSIDLSNSISDSSLNILDESNSFDINKGDALPQDSTDFSPTHMFNYSNDFDQDILDNTISKNNTNDIELQSESNINNASNDDIDFSSIFALQDEFLKDQNKDKPKAVIGGDIYTKKDSNHQKQFQNDQLLNNTIKNDHLTTHDVLDNIDNNLDINKVEKNDVLDQISNLNFNDGFKTSSVEENKKMNDNYFTDSASNFDADILSDEELDELDDEALLKLQENSQEDDMKKIVINDDPKILNKDDINEVTTILEDTKNASLTSALDNTEFKMENNELDSLTQEALSEAIDETNMNNDFNFDDELSSLDGTLLSDTIDASISNMDNPVQKPVNFESKSNNSASNILSNPNLDLTEIVKSFPVDKLRDLLSGVQITINITFPTKK